MKKSRIAGIGHYIPERTVTNQELSERMNTTHEWIVERSGIHERHYSKLPEESTHRMGVMASEKALKMAGLEAKDIDLIVFSTLSPDYYFPGSGVLLQREMDFRNIAAIDVRAQCSGFVYGLSIADQFIKTGMYKNVLLVGAEVHSAGLDYSDAGRHISVLFGDGAGAAVLTATNDDKRGIYSTHLHSQGKFAEELATLDPGMSKNPRTTHEMMEPGGSFYPIMNGQLVFKNAIVRFEEVINEALEANNYTAQDIDLLFPHQANLRISQFVQKKMGLPNEKVINTIQKYGNTTAASIPISMCEALEEGKINEGDLICLAAFGSGFTWASALLRW